MRFIVSLISGSGGFSSRGFSTVCTLMLSLRWTQNHSRLLTFGAMRSDALTGFSLTTTKSAALDEPCADVGGEPCELCDVVSASVFFDAGAALVVASVNTRRDCCRRGKRRAGSLIGQRQAADEPGRRRKGALTWCLHLKKSKISLDSTQDPN